VPSFDFRKLDEAPVAGFALVFEQFSLCRVTQLLSILFYNPRCALA